MTVLPVLSTPPTIGEPEAVKALASLAHAQRLRVFKALVMAGSQGLTPGTMAAQHGMASSALSFHLKELANAGLVTTRAQGRNLIYRASFTKMNELLGYLTEHCCAGSECAVNDAQACY